MPHLKKREESIHIFRNLTSAGKYNRKSSGIEDNRVLRPSVVIHLYKTPVSCTGVLSHFTIYIGQVLHRNAFTVQHSYEMFLCCHIIPFVQDTVTYTTVPTIFMGHFCPALQCFHVLLSGHRK